MLNFLSNALKFTPENGSIIIETIVKETQDMRGVRNDGSSNSRKESSNRSILKMMNEFEMMAAKKCLTPRNHHKMNNHRELKSALKVEEGQKKYIKFEIRITDSGCGISPENLNKLFLNFSRLEDH